MQRCVTISTLGLVGFKFLKRAEIGGILADDMGLGKTIQALCA